MSPDDDLTSAVAARAAAELARFGALVPRAACTEERAVHELRVSWRRAKAALVVLRRRGRGIELDRSAFDDAAELARALGAVRDAQVALRWLDAHVGPLRTSERLRAALRDSVDAQRPRRRVVERAACGARALERTLAARAAKSPAAHVGGRTRVVDHVASLTFDSLERAARWPVGRLASSSVLHAARVDLKRLRDVASLFAPAMGGLPPSWSRTSDTLQRALGSVHDLDALARWIERRDLPSRGRVGSAMRLARAVAFEEAVALWSRVVGREGRRALALRLAGLEVGRRTATARARHGS